MTDQNNKKQQPKEASNKPGIGNIFWGVAFLTIGVLALLNNFDVINVAFGELWRLWPLIIVFIGFSILPIKGAGRTLIGILLALVTIVAAVYVTTANQHNVQAGEQTATIARSNNIDSAEVSIRAGAGDLRIQADNELNDLLVAELTSNNSNLNYTSSVENGVEVVDLSLDARTTWWRGHWRNDLNVFLNNDLPVDLKVDSGAASITADLASVQAKNVSFSTGASSLDLTIGKLASSVTVDVSAGASSVLIRLPRDAGVQLQTSGALTSTDAPNLSEVRSNVFQSDDYGSSDVTIDITTSISAGSLEIKWY